MSIELIVGLKYKVVFPYFYFVTKPCTTKTNLIFVFYIYHTFIPPKQIKMNWLQIPFRKNNLKYSSIILTAFVNEKIEEPSASPGFVEIFTR